MVTVTLPSIYDSPKGSLVMAMLLKDHLLLAKETSGEISQEAEGQDFGEHSLGFPFLSLMWLHLEM